MPTNTRPGLLICAVLVMLRVNKIHSSSPPPSMGDVRLDPFPGEPNYYEVLVYYTDQIEVPSFGGICSNNRGGEGSIICRQLGYRHIASTHRSTGHPVWLKEVSCDFHDVHILSCHHTVVTGSEKSACNSTLLVQCDFSTSWYKEFYEGQIALCPADNQTSNNTWSSTSFGVISLYFNGTWRGLHLASNTSLHSFEADTICRQLGFTGAVRASAVAITATKFTFENCYTRLHPYTVRHGAWLAANDIHCSHPQSCLGCCYRYPMIPRSPSCGHDMIIKCIFEPSEAEAEAVTGKVQPECHFNDKMEIPTCEQENMILAERITDTQIKLCPPINVSNNNNTLFGLITMYLSGNDSWRGLNQPDNHRLGENEADTICRQLGYEEAVPGSVVTRRELRDYDFNHCYGSTSRYKVQPRAWITTTDIHCSSNTQVCIGCCFTYPSSNRCGHCSDLDDIVIQCTLDSNRENNLNPGAGHSQSVCEFNRAFCYPDPDNQRTIIIGLSVGVGVAILMILALVLLVCGILISASCRRQNPIYRNI